MGTKIDIGGIGRDQRGIIAGGDVKDVELFQAGDVSGSYNVIGHGANLVIQQVEAFSPAAESERAEDVARRRLAQAVRGKVESYQRLVQKSNAERLNPYKSLNFYRLEDAPFFYGRAQAIPELLDKIHQRRLTILYADSGAGKSSLLQAGIQARLLAAGHLAVDIRLRGHEPVSQTLKKAVAPELAAELTAEPLDAFLTKANRLLGQSSLYLLLDQFEEFFIKLAPEHQKTFIAELNDCLDQSELDVRWVLSLRGEYLYRLHQFGSRARTNEYYLPPFIESEARQVIIEPAGGQQTDYETGLVERILSDLARQTAESAEGYGPPQVQLVCHTLFEQVKVQSPPRTITHSGYEAQGAASGILTSHLDRTISRLPDRLEQDIAHEVLEALVTVSLEKHPMRDARTASQLLDEVQQRVRRASTERVQDVLSFLVDNYLLRVERDLDLGDRYELTHDYLLGEIELDPATQQRKLAEQMLRQEVEAYLSSGKKTRIAADKLSLIEPHVENMVLNNEAQELLQASQEALQRQKRLVFAGGGIVAVMIIAAIISVITAIGARGAASAAQEDATAAAYALATAETRQAAAETAVAEAVIARDAIQETGTAVAATATAAAYALQAEVIFTFDNYEGRELPPGPLFAESASLEIAMAPSSSASQSLQVWSQVLVMEEPTVYLTSTVQNVDQQVSATVDGTTVRQVNTFTDFVGELGEYINPDRWQDATVEAILSATSPDYRLVDSLQSLPPEISFDAFYGIVPATRASWGDDYNVSPVMPAILDIYVAGRKVASLDGIVAAVGEWDEDVRGLYVTRFLTKE